MKFKQLIESELITELSQDGKWVTFKNGQHTYISKDGEIETGALKGYNVNNKKAIKGKYKQLQDQAAKKKKQEEKAKKREESKLTDAQKKQVNQDLDRLAQTARQYGIGAEHTKEIFNNLQKKTADYYRSKKDSRDKSKSTDKQFDALVNKIEHYGERSNSEKSQRKHLRKELERLRNF